MEALPPLRQAATPPGYFWPDEVGNSYSLTSHVLVRNSLIRGGEPKQALHLLFGMMFDKVSDVGLFRFWDQLVLLVHSVGVIRVRVCYCRSSGTIRVRSRKHSSGTTLRLIRAMRSANATCFELGRVSRRRGAVRCVSISALGTAD